MMKASLLAEIAVYGVLGIGVFAYVRHRALTCPLRQSSTAHLPPEMAPATATLRPLAAPPKVPSQIQWLTSLEEAQMESARSGKPIFVDFYAPWCAPCKKLEARTYPDPNVIAESQKWVMVKINTDAQSETAKRYAVVDLPTLTVLRANGQPLPTTHGFLSAPHFVEFLRDSRREIEAMTAKAPA